MEIVVASQSVHVVNRVGEIRLTIAMPGLAQRGAALSDVDGDAGWPTYSHDHHHSGNVTYPAGSLINEQHVDEPSRIVLPWSSR